ncbi:uncharacterized protein LOC5575051 [Aedes aegypti]|uniref:Bub1 n=1 Tax=Aedes aegypti TaxID=7159 RepID=A0A903VM37_AEDAE|nr:uncharacterized protein LOC5575051 [Aedes aegypti]
MEDLEKTKENIQPLRGGRNVEQLEIALTSESQLAEERRQHEQRIEKYEGDDPLLPWYEYICWIEQTDISNGKTSGSNEILLRCIEKFETEERYHQDHRFIKLCMKYIDTQRSPQELYQELYHRGIGTLCAELYIGWAYYYDAEDNFAQTESVFQKGFDAGATPREDLEQAHRQFGFSMSQRLLHKDESSKLTFKSSLEERRNALTSLKAHKKRHVGSVRTGLAVKSFHPGIVNQENIPNGPMNSNVSLPVYSGAAETSASNQSIVRSLVNHARDRENVREPGPWSNVKSHHKRGPLFGTTHEPSFKISEDPIEFQPIPVLVDNLSRGIQLSVKHKRQNYPQKPFELAVCDDDKPSGFPVYDKLALYCRGSKEDFCPEELRGYRYFKRRGIVNKMTEQYDPIWANGSVAGIRLHPYHVREYRCRPGDDLKTEKPTIGTGTQGMQTRIAEIYATDREEMSIEELRMQKWKDGKIKRHIDHKHDDDMMRIDMDETIVQTKRVSIAPPRVSMMPPTQPGVSRKSVLPPKINAILEEADETTASTSKVVPPEEISGEAKYTGAIKKSDIYKRRSVDSPDIKPGPKKKISLEGQLPENEIHEQEQPEFVVPVVKPKSKLTIPIFVDDEEPAENKDTNSYYPNESCSTQMFNMFVKSQSTPLALKAGPTRKSDVPVRRPNLSFDEHDEVEPPVQDENLAQLHPMKTNDENAEPESLIPLGSNITHAPKQLSTIMERTENSTMSGAGSTKSSVSSPPVGEIISPMPGIPSDDERSCERNMKQAVKNLTNFQLESTKEDSVFKVPETLANVAPKSTDVSSFNVFQDEAPVATKPVTVSPFVIHIDSTETMANVPLVSKMDLPQPVLDDKENKLLTNAEPRQDTHFQVQEEPTTTGTTNTLFRNVSHLPQRDLGVNSIMSFKMTTERTNTVPLPLVKQPVAPASPPKPSKADDSLFEVLAKTPSPKGLKQKSFFDLADFQKTPQPKVPEVREPPAKQQPSTIGSESTIPAPKPIIIQSVMGAINLADFPSPPKRGSIEDLNTEIFSLHMNNVKNSTLLPGSFPAEFDAPMPTEISPGDAKPLRNIDFEISRSEVEMRKLDLDDKKIDSDGFTVPAAPVFKSPIIIELDDGDSDELGKSIYVQKPQTTSSEKIQRWDEIDENFNPQNNAYVKKETDPDETMQFIYQQTQTGEIDPFDPKLQEAFLEQLDFMKYIEELSTCSLVNKVQPLSKGMVVNICDTKFSVQKKIGEGTFGMVYSAKNLSSNKVVAMKQERPANLWEYYICLELRSRVNNDDILPGMMSVDYAIVGNNASILVSPFSRFGNILDVCNVVKRVTSKNVDEFIAMVITSQILSIIDHLHSCMIIHADIKPDNFLLMNPVDLDSAIPCVQLIDFGVSIDLKLFPKDTTFRKVVTTECFTCIEMLERRPWTYQPDLYGVAGTTHVMLFGTYMEVQKDIVNWNIKARMPRYFRKTVWDNYFSSMLNIRDCNEMPNLQALRGRLLAEIEENRKYIRDKVSEFNQAILSG